LGNYYFSRVFGFAVHRAGADFQKTRRAIRTFVNGKNRFDGELSAIFRFLERLAEFFFRLKIAVNLFIIAFDLSPRSVNSTNQKTSKNKENKVNKNSKPSLTVAVFLLFLSAAFVYSQNTETTSEQKQNSAQTASTPMDKKELRLKACGTEKVNYAAKTDKTQHPTPDAPADKALIYVIRSAMIGYKIDSKLAVNGKWMGVNRGKTYFFFTLEPGEHYFCSESENQDYLALKVEAGKTYYLQQQVEMGMWKARTNLVVLNEEQGKKKLENVNLSVFELKTK
jgi:hypothetical protein